MFIFCSELTDNSKLNPIKDEKNKSGRGWIR